MTATQNIRRPKFNAAEARVVIAAEFIAQGIDLLSMDGTEISRLLRKWSDAEGILPVADRSDVARAAGRPWPTTRPLLAEYRRQVRKAA